MTIIGGSGSVRVAVVEVAVGWLRRHDPHLYALHRAVRITLVVVIVLVLTDLVLDSPAMVPFGVFGVLALLLFTDFPGRPSARLAAYLMLALTGAVLITLGTLLSGSWVWGAAGMAVVGVLVTYSGALSAVLASGSRAALLTFILPVTIPGTVDDLGVRLAGWLVAVVLSVPAALLIWPPQEHDRIREAAAVVCRDLAGRLRELAHPVPVASGGAAGAAGAAAVDALQTVLRATSYRPVALTTGSRLLLRLVDELEWLHGLVRRVDPVSTAERPERTRRVCAAAAEVLDAAVDTLDDPRRAPDPAARARLDAALCALAATRREVVAHLLSEAPTPAADDGRLHRIHAWAHATALVGGTVRAAAAADARPVVDRLLGRQAPETASSVPGPLAAAEQLGLAGARLHSVWLQNSLRTGLGLGLAVLLAGVLDVQHGFWVALGAMSILRTSALTTTSTVLRAMAGTLAGFAVGAVIVIAVGGVGPAALWVLLPLCILVAGFAPETVSFAAGQAAFTVLVLVLFNILSPAGWRVGLVRLEDVALGCAAGLLVGALVWPRGGVVELRASLAEAYRTAALLLRTAAAGATAPRDDAADRAAKAAGLRLDAAFRQYLAEGRTSGLSRSEVTSAVNGAGRLRLTAEAIAGLDATDRFVDAQAGAVADWFDAFGAALRHGGTVSEAPAPRSGPVALRRLRSGSTGKAEPAVALLWAALYVDDAAELAGQARRSVGGLIS